MPQTVLLHPIGLDHAAWQWVDLPGAVAPDLPGFGAAEPLDELSLAAVADSVCDRVTGPFNLVGLSLGGMVAQHLALRHPDRVASLVIGCASSTASRSVMVERAEAVERVGLAGVLDGYLSRWFTKAALTAVEHPGVSYARARILADDPAVIAAYWRAMSEHDVRDALGDIAVPTTVVAGRADVSSSLAGLEDMAARIPSAVLRVVDGPHMLLLDGYDGLRAVLHEHLSRTESSDLTIARTNVAGR